MKCRIFLLIVLCIAAIAGFLAGREYEFRRHAKSEISQRIVRLIALRAALRGIERNQDALVFLKRYYSLGLVSVDSAVGDYDAFLRAYARDVSDSATAWTLSDKQAEIRELERSELPEPTKTR